MLAGLYCIDNIKIKELLSSTSESTDHHSDSVDEPWSARRSRIKRRRSQLQDEGGQSSTVIHKGPLVIGVSSPSKQISSSIKAAQKPAIVKKLIFCIGNVDPTCTIQVMCDHVTAVQLEIQARTTLYELSHVMMQIHVGEEPILTM